MGKYPKIYKIEGLSIIGINNMNFLRFIVLNAIYITHISKLTHILLYLKYNIFYYVIIFNCMHSSLQIA